MVAAAGNFITDPNGNVEVSGTVRAQNFFHKVCVSDGTYYSNYKYYSNGAYYDIEVSGSKKCSYDADFVHVYVGGSGVVFLLPMPWDFDGKLVTINSHTTAQQALNFEVQCPFQDDDQNAPNVFPEGVYVTNSGIAWTLLSYKSTIRAGIQVAFLSQKVNGKSYWLRLGTNYGVV
jgi:hypothetical protein